MHAKQVMYKIINVIGVLSVDSLVIKQQDHILIVAPQHKRMDAAFALKFREQILTLIEQGHKKIILNLEKIEFIDSSGLGVLVAIMKILGGRQNLALYAVNELVLKVFKLTRMDQIFIIAATELEAINHFSKVISNQQNFQ